MVNEILTPILKNLVKADVAPKHDFGQVPVSRKCKKADSTRAVVVRRKSTTPVFPSNYRLVLGQRASLETVPPPRDRLSVGGQSELISWWFVPDHIHGTSSSTPMSRYNRLALAVSFHQVCS